MDGSGAPLVTLILCVDPMQEQANGPMWWPFDPDILYEIKIDNSNDAVADIVDEAIEDEAAVGAGHDRVVLLHRISSVERPAGSVGVRDGYRTLHFGYDNLFRIVHERFRYHFNKLFHSRFPSDRTSTTSLLGSCLGCWNRVSGSPLTVPRDPQISAVRLAGDSSKSTVTIIGSPDDPGGCTNYLLYRRCVTQGLPWVQLSTILPCASR